MNARCATFALLLSLTLPGWAWGQYNRPEFESPRDQGVTATAEAKETARLDQKNGQTIPLGLTFLDETGEEVVLSTFFKTAADEGRPVVIQPAYYNCPTLCGEISVGVAKVMSILALPEDEFSVLTVSFVPEETPELAASNKVAAIEAAERPELAGNWHFLTAAPGHEGDADALMNALGYGYGFIEDAGIWTHPSAIVVVSPTGKISRYLVGTRFDDDTLRLALVEASNNQVGSWTDALILTCFQWDPAVGRYSRLAFGALQIAAIVTVLTIGTGVGYLLMRERRLNPQTTPENAAA